MKCISLWQPWSSLIALGEKRIETRSWDPHYCGPIAIHAAKKWNNDLRQLCVVREPFRSVLIKHGVIRPSQAYGMTSPVVDLPLGRIVAVANLLCVVSADLAPQLCGPGGEGARHELEFGDYSPGRFAWVLRDVRPLRTGIPIRGYQRIWTLDDNCAALVKRLAE